MLLDGNFLNYIIAIYNCCMETTSRKEAIRLAVLSVGATSPRRRALSWSSKERES